MAIVAKTSRPTTLGQRFRLLTEALLMEAAQKAMLREYPNTGASPYPKTGPTLRSLPLPLPARVQAHALATATAHDAAVSREADSTLARPGLGAGGG